MISIIQRIVVASLSVICCGIVANAVTLQAKVVEVPSGNLLVVMNTNRSIRVRLKAVAPPDMGQPFNDTARDHLKRLVLDKTVTVEYTHFAEGYLDAKVLLDGIDIGSQMLRDGVAWYDHAGEYELNASDRELYAQCERAARSEKRGIWQDASPVSPWEYRRLQKAKLEQAASQTPSLRVKSNVASERLSLSNADLISGLAAGSNSSSFSGLKPLFSNGTFYDWTTYESPIGHFSVSIPTNALETSGVSSDDAGGSGIVEIVAAGSQNGMMMLLAGEGSNGNRTDATILDPSIRSLIDGWNRGASRHGTSGVITIKPGRDLNLNGYAGRQYNLTSELFSGTARVFTKQTGDQRRIFVLISLTTDGFESVSGQFLNSFKPAPVPVNKSQ